MDESTPAPMVPLDRRRALCAAAAAWAGLALWPALARATAAEAPADGPLRLATAWRSAGADGVSADRVGVLEIDWAGGRVRIVSEHRVPSRAHGLLALPDGGFLAVANRPGRWMLRCDAEGRVMQQLDSDREPPARTLNGHVETSTDARWLYTTETEFATQRAWISVRDARTLERVAQFATGGIDAHQLLRAPDGTLLVANGGILRDVAARKIEPERMAPSLARLDPAAGRVMGLWQLEDRRLSLRHIAWADSEHGADRAGSAESVDTAADAMPLLGVALQAEHDRVEARREAPALAIWDGRELTVPSADASAAGYVGDIAAAPGGGFVMSAQKAGRGLWWHPGAPRRLTLVAAITEPCALASADDGAGVLISAGRGVALWHARLAPRMLPWPVALAPDNHWVRLRTV